MFSFSVVFGKFCAKITKYQHFTSNVDKLLGYRKQKNIKTRDIGSIVANISELNFNFYQWHNVSVLNKSVSHLSEILRGHAFCVLFKKKIRCHVFCVN